MNNGKFPKKEMITLCVGEVIAALLTVLAFWLVGAIGLFGYEFSYTAITGAALGVAVILANFVFLSISVNRAIDEFMQKRGEGELSDEEAEKFTKENSAGVNKAMTTSFLVRCVSIAIALIVAFLLKFFNPIATLVPILCYQPILTWGNYLRGVFENRKMRKNENELQAENGETTEEAEEISENSSDENNENDSLTEEKYTLENNPLLENETTENKVTENGKSDENEEVI